MQKPTPSNRLRLDYRAEAALLGPTAAPIIDIHSHISGERAARVYAEAARLYSVELTYSMTPMPSAGRVRDILGDSIRFIAIHDWRNPDRHHAFRQGFLDDIEVFHRDFGARIVKIWNAPRWRDFNEGPAGDDVRAFDSPWRVRVAEMAQSLGMMIMVHVADPDTWFKTKYADATKYGSKLDQYEAFERMVDRFSVPWIAAHMGGWPEDLAFLDGLLSRHPNLHLDTSATKWQVRELGRHSPAEVRAFMTKWKGRILFGSDIVTTDEHFISGEKGHPMGVLADSEAAAFDLYASRYWALRTMFETDHEGESPIADPDLQMVDPERHDAMSAPMLRGLALEPGLLKTIYHDAAAALLREPAQGG